MGGPATGPATRSTTVNDYFRRWTDTALSTRLHHALYAEFLRLAERDPALHVNPAIIDSQS